MTSSFHIALWWLGHLVNVLKLTTPSKIDKITHALPVPVLQQIDFTAKRVVVLRLHDTVAKFRTGVKFSLRYNNRGELTPVWLVPVWHFVVVSCRQIQSHEREPKWARAGLKFAPVSRQHPLIKKKLSERTLNWPEKILHSYTYERRNYSSCQFV